MKINNEKKILDKNQAPGIINGIIEGLIERVVWGNFLDNFLNTSHVVLIQQVLVSMKVYFVYKIE